MEVNFGAIVDELFKNSIIENTDSMPALNCKNRNKTNNNQDNHYFFKDGNKMEHYTLQIFFCFIIP